MVFHEKKTRTSVFAGIVFIFLGFMGAESTFAAVQKRSNSSDPIIIELHYQSGVKFYQRGQYGKAVEEFEKTLSLDPDHQEAKGYLDKAQQAQNERKYFDSKKSKDPELKPLYAKGKLLYKQGEYERANQIFDQILSVKRVDDFASFYKERSEAIIAKRLAREAKIQTRRQNVEKSKRDKLKSLREKESAKLERQEMLAKRRQIRAERREEKKDDGRMEKEELKITKNASLGREEKLSLKTEARALAQEKRKEKLEAKERARREKIEAVQAAKDEAAVRRESHRKRAKDKKDLSKKQKQEKKQEVSERKQEAQDLRAMFLDGVALYGRGDFSGSIQALKKVVESEKGSAATYTQAAQRMIEKARKRIQEVKVLENAKEI